MASIKRHYTLRLVAALVCVLIAYTLVLYFIHMEHYRLMVTAVLLMVAAVVWLWHTLRYPLRQVSHFLRALRGRDLMMRFPTSRDPLIGQACNDMNEILQLYWDETNELERSKRYYDRMLRVMTHELRNTVAPIVSLTDDVLSHPDMYDKERTHECLTIINEQAEGINTFLTSYHQLTNVPEPKCQHIVVSELFAKLGRLLRNEKGHCRLELNAPTGMRLYADPHLLTLTLINLVRNAAQSLEGCKDAQIEVRATTSEGKAYITVTDNGPGIPQNRIEHIFEPFYSTKKSGSGIGLALAQQIMMAHGGSITVSSQPDKRTTFTLEFSDKKSRG